jgi:PAS domain S-box-containing protein
MAEPDVSGVVRSGLAVEADAAALVIPELLKLPVAVVHVDERRVVRGWNGAAEVLYGWAAPDTLGKPISGLTVGPVNAELADAILEQVGSGRHWAGTFDARRSDGSLISVRAVTMPVLGADGAFAGSVGIAMHHHLEQADLIDQIVNLRRLADDLDRVRIDERARLAGDLHDDVGQVLTAVLTSVKGLRADPARLDETLDYLERYVTRGLQSLQQLVGVLARPSFDDSPLSRLLSELGLQVARRTGSRLTLDVETSLDSLPADRTGELYRVAEEMLTNVERHAQAEHITLRLTRTGDVARLIVIDDGNGGLDANGLGVRLMQARIRRLGGRVTYRSVPGKGTEVRALFPATADGA